MIEEQGVATVAISLIRPQTENTKPPRALWVPFELGRPFGPPNDPTFQKRVVLTALGMLVEGGGPVRIIDFPDDDPRARPDPAWQPPFMPAAVVSGSAEFSRIPAGGGNIAVPGGTSALDGATWPQHGGAERARNRRLCPLCRGLAARQGAAEPPRRVLGAADPALRGRRSEGILSGSGGCRRREAIEPPTHRLVLERDRDWGGDPHFARGAAGA